MSAGIEGKLKLWDETVERIERGYLLSVKCLNCSRQGTLRPERLLDRYGAGALAHTGAGSALDGLLTCSKCQSRRVTWELSPPGPPTLMSAKFGGWRFRSTCTAPLYYTKKGTRSCLYSRLLDVDTMIAVFGPDFLVSRLPERLHCPLCNTKNSMIACEKT